MAMSGASSMLIARRLQDSLTLDDRKPRGKASAPPQRHPSDPRASRRGENKPLIKPSKTSHRPTRSQEEAMKARRLPASAPRPVPSGSPQRKQPPQPPQQPPRRNSESSIMDFNVQPITEELKMIESNRLRERQRRDGRPSGRETREGKDRSKPRRPSRRLDIIDQLDATSIYGTGLFHHDGPFDALNPHRNRQNSRRAPMQAFPKDSLNNSLGGAGPLNRNPDHAIFMGNGTDEAFRDYAGSAKNTGGNAYPGPCSSGEAAIFDPVARGSIVHGDESCGLGTSTFLEGTPAARTAIARREAEQAQELVEGGLQRKKSLVQRIRHINKGPRDFAPSVRMMNPDGAYSRLSPEPGPSGGSAGSESNPFFSEFSKGEETISVKPRDGTCLPKTPPRGPRRLSGGALERRANTGGTTPLEEAAGKPTGLLGRMKSLKGGRKASRTLDQAQVQAQAQSSGMIL